MAIQYKSPIPDVVEAVNNDEPQPRSDSDDVEVEEASNIFCHSFNIFN